MNTQKSFIRTGGYCERMPFWLCNIRTIQKNILTRLNCNQLTKTTVWEEKMRCRFLWLCVFLYPTNKNYQRVNLNFWTYFVIETSFLHSKFKYTTWMLNSLKNNRVLTSSNNTKNSFDQIKKPRASPPLPECGRLQNLLCP
jgi:hypothetical protein